MTACDAIRILIEMGKLFHFIDASAAAADDGDVNKMMIISSSASSSISISRCGCTRMVPHESFPVDNRVRFVYLAFIVV